ncbi:MAG: aspartate aminotransferase family protein [Neisseriaceae bacterium]|nr:aspartate aminotransferase family protein [Neisseriaceae bacterium]
MSKNAISKADGQYHLHPFSDNKALREEGVRVIERADGIYLYDSEGNKILDGMGGLWCVNIGYGRKELAEVAKKQMETLGYYNTFFKTTHPAVVALSETLNTVTPEGFDYIFYTNSGSESVDTMIRMVRHYWASVGKPEKNVLIGRWNGYHGSTIAGASMGGMKGMHKQSGTIAGIEHIEQPWYYGLGGDLTPEEFGLKAAQWLEDKILEVGADKVAAFVGEPIQGAGGVIIPPSTYWPRIQEICQKHDILLVADEVICGFGRTGNWFGFETMGFMPDMFTSAKGISSGYQPIGAVFINKRVADGLMAGGDFEHGFTYSGHPVAAAVAKANVEILKNENIVKNVHDDIGPYMQKRWRETFSPFKYVDDVRGVGMMQGFTLVKDKASRTLFDGADGAGVMCRDIFFKNNLIMRACGDHMVSAPPLVMTRAEVDEMMAIATKCMQAFEVEMDQKLGR